jgi:membrane associated rhomboid family serine protease
MDSSRSNPPQPPYGPYDERSYGNRAPGQGWSGRGVQRPGSYGQPPVRRMTDDSRMNPFAAAFLILGLLALMWFLEFYDQSTRNSLDRFGIHARQLIGLPEIFTAPFLHGSFEHLSGNSLPFLVFGFIVALGGFTRWLKASLICVIASGLAAWLLTPPGTIVLGASGLIMGWLTYIITRGFFDRRPGRIILGLVVLFFYGGLIWGVLPSAPGVSWQAHLGGAIGGVVAARVLHGRRSA